LLLFRLFYRAVSLPSPEAQDRASYQPAVVL
jgi:hypothetical protein